MGFKFDARDDKEKMLAFLTFESYLNSSSITEYNRYLSDISDRYHKSISYLKSLRNVYIDVYASKEEKQMYKEKKNKLKLNAAKYMVYCDKLFELPSEERNYYVVSSNIPICIVFSYLDKYKRNNGKYCDLVDDFFEQYKVFFEKYKIDEIKKNNFDMYKKSCMFFDNLVDMGFYNLSGYVKHISISYDDFKKNYRVGSEYRKNIRKYDEDSWTYYELLMKENKKQNFLFVKDKILSFCSKLINNENVDIIDYYMMVGIPFDDFLQLSKDTISSYEMTIFKRFICSYQSIDPYYCDNYFNSNIIVSNSIKEKVLYFLHNNGIPFEYYNCALNKYLSGDLDQYIGNSKKKTNL